jgi:hypothetical protein
MWLTGIVRKRRVDECDCQDAHNLHLLGVLGVLGPTTITVLTFLDRLTPWLAGVLNFRVRIITAAILTAGLLVIVVIIVFQKHALGRPQVLHHSYRKKERLGAKIVILPLLITFSMSLYSLRFLYGQGGSLQGQVLGASDAPVKGAKVDVVNLDKESVCERIEETDTLGRFVVDIVSSRGRPAYWSLTCPSESLPKLEKFPDTLVGVLASSRGANEKNLKSDQVSLHLICPGN